MVQAYVEELLEAGEKFLVFCHHKVMIDGLLETLNRYALRVSFPQHTYTQVAVHRRSCSLFKT